MMMYEGDASDEEVHHPNHIPSDEELESDEGRVAFIKETSYHPCSLDMTSIGLPSFKHELSVMRRVARSS